MLCFVPRHSYRYVICYGITKRLVADPAAFLREALSRVLHDLMEFEVQQIGAKRHERSPERATYRNGTREREWQTRVERRYFSQASMERKELAEPNEFLPAPDKPVAPIR